MFDVSILIKLYEKYDWSNNSSVKCKFNKRSDGLTSSVATLTIGPEIEPLWCIIEIHIKVPPISMYNMDDVKQPMKNI